MNILSSIKLFVGGVFLFLASHLGITVPQSHSNALGATGIIPQTAALFQQQLASSLPTNGTTMTLSSNLTYYGTALQNGYYAFTIDNGTPQVETVEGNVSGTSVTGLIRGIDPQNPNVTSSALIYPHSAGAYVQITNSSWTQHITRILQGSDTLPNALTYAVHSPCSLSASTTLIDLACANSVASSGALDAGIGTKGLVAIINPNGPVTSIDGSQVLYNLISKQYYASSSQATTSVVVTNTSGTIDPSFIGSSTSYTFGSITTASATFSNATSSILTTNSTGGLLGVQNPGSGFFIASGTSYAFLAHPFIESLYNTSTISIVGGIGSSTSIASTTVNTNNINALYQIYFYSNLGNGVSHSSTIAFAGTNLMTCNPSNTTGNYTYNGTLKMLNSTSTAYISILGFYGVSPTSSLCGFQGVVPITVGVTSSINVTAGIQNGANVTSTLDVLQF